MKALTQFLLIISILSTLSTNEISRLDIIATKNQQASFPTVSKLVKQLTEAKSLPQIQTIIIENPQLISLNLIEAMLKIKEIDPLLDNADKAKAEMLNRALLGLAQRVNHQKGVAITINHLGAIYAGQGQYDLAIKYHKHCLTLLTQPGDKLLLSKTHRLLGRIYYIQKNYFAAREQYIANFKLAKMIGNPYYLAQAHSLLGIAYEENELFKEAIQEYNTSLAISQAITQPPPEGNLPSLIGATLLRTGRSYLGSGQLDKAMNSYQQAVDHWRRVAESPEQASELSSALNSFGYASFEAGLHQQAIEASTKSREIAEKPNVITREARKNELLALSNRVIALAYSAMGNNTEAVKAITEAKEYAERARQSEIRRIIYRVEGIVYEAAKQPKLAREAFDKAIRLTEEQQALVPLAIEAGPSSMGYSSSSYARMIALMVSQKQSEEALKYSEMLKSRALFNLLDNPKNRETGFIPPHDLKQREQLTDQILNLEVEISKRQFASLSNNTDIAELQSRFNEKIEWLTKLVKKINQELLATSETGLRSTNSTKQSLKSLLHNDRTALLQFTTSVEQTFLFVATKSAGEVDLQVYLLGLKNDQIASKVRHFRELITGQEQSNELEFAARDLHDNLLGVAQSQLKNKSELIIVPDGPLWELPFQALKTADNHYLIERAAISYALSFSILQMSPKQTASPVYDLLAFGNPSLGSQKRLEFPDGSVSQPLQNLPDADKLVNKLRRFYNPATSRVLTHALATEESYKSLAPKFRVIHLAAHGIFNDIDPMRSGIVLAQPGGRVQTGRNSVKDGFLEAREIARINLSAEMVVLSACETGRGQMRGGEGVVGLPWAIFLAGCPTTIVSQWEVDSGGTTDLMTLMYSHLNLNDNRATKAVALQKAAISMLNNPNKDFRHPFYWAGFIIFGKAN